MAKIIGPLLIQSDTMAATGKIKEISSWLLLISFVSFNVIYFLIDKLEDHVQEKYMSICSGSKKHEHLQVNNVWRDTKDVPWP